MNELGFSLSFFHVLLHTGNTTYQCQYACAHVRTQRKREEREQLKRENPCAKIRADRRSKKRDCKASLFVKSIVAFPEYSITERLRGVSSKKGVRKLKAATLGTLRGCIERGELQGEPGFWLHVPLPQAHTTHDVLDVSQDGSCFSDAMNDDIANLLQCAPMKGLALNLPSYLPS